jgi:O-antigen ligase
LAVTPIVHPTAPFLIEIPGTGIVLAPAGRYLTWSAAAAEFARHPLIGHGIGIDAVDVRYFSPSLEMQSLSDAHNALLNVAAQCGAIGVAGLLFLIVFAARLSLPWRPAEARPASIGLGLIFLNGFVYQGLGGSFEDARHLWVLLGLLIAAARLERGGLIRADGNNRKAGGPSLC